MVPVLLIPSASENKAMNGNVKSWNAVRIHRMKTQNREMFGKNIQEAREMKGWTQTRLAEALHVGKSFVCNWESGFSRPDIGMVPSLCRTLNMSIYEFYGWPAAHRDMERSEIQFLRDYMELEHEDQQMIMQVMQRMLCLEAADTYDACRHQFMKVPQYDSEDFFKARHGNHYRWVRGKGQQSTRPFLVTVSGSTLAPVYEDDDDLLGSQTTEITEGKHGLVLLDEELVILKREGDLLTGLGGTIRVPYKDRKRLKVLGEILGKLIPEEMPDAQERMVLGNTL